MEIRDRRDAPIRLRADGMLCQRSDDRTVPIVTVPTPRLSWVVPLDPSPDRSGQRQTAYRIRVSSSPHEESDIFDSGEVESSASVGVAWPAPQLPPHTRWWWTVRTRDDRGSLSDWAEPVPVDSAAYAFGDWRAEWVAPPVLHAITGSLEPVEGEIVTARLSIGGWGPSRAWVGDSVVADHDLSPTDSSLRRATARTYDVLDLVRESSGPISVTIAASTGHYRRIFRRPRVIAELRLRLSDGSTRILGTSPSWIASPTEITVDDPFYLEEHDLRRASRPRPTSVGSPDSPSVRGNPEPMPADIVPDAGPPVRVVRVVEGTEVGVARSSDPGAPVRVWDIGENVAARVELHLGGLASGTRIECVVGEKLDGRGRVDTTNIRLPDDRDRERQVFAVIADGPELAASPWFAVAGFRYVEVRGLPAAAAATVRARVLHTDAERTGRLETDVPEIGRVVDYAMRTQLNNTHGYPEDCPTREQGGWTGDAAASAEAALDHLDLTGMYRNWLADVALDAGESGAVPGIAPIVLDAAGRQPSDPVWGAALTEVPLRVWWATGESWLIEPLLPAMRRWADWQLSTLVEGVVRNAEISYGADWLAPVQTPPVILQTGAVVASLRALAELEAACGNDGEADRRSRAADEVAAAARRSLHDVESGEWGNGSQGSLGTALGGLALPDERDLLRARLTADVRARGNRLSTGYAATRSVVRALAEGDGGDALMDCVLQPEQPGIGAMLVDGPGTFWETWWIDDDNVGVASLDHIGLAAPFSAWVWRDVAGLRAIEPGFERFALEPRLRHRVSSARFERETPRGTIAVAWHSDDDSLTAEITVPVGATAEVVAGSDARVDGVTVEPVTRSDGRSFVELGTGRHTVSTTGLPVLPPVAHEVPPIPERAGTVWLSDGRLVVPEASDEGVRIAVEVERVVCSPVYHEPLGPPTVSVAIDDLSPDRDHWLDLPLPYPLDLSPATFLFTSFDVDNNAGIFAETLRLRIRAESIDGSARESTVRPLPIAWNRATLDLTDWTGSSRVGRVSVGVRWDPPETEPVAPRPFTYLLGRIGWTSAPRTW